MVLLKTNNETNHNLLKNNLLYIFYIMDYFPDIWDQST